jgi:hypothetical protein
MLGNNGVNYTVLMSVLVNGTRPTEFKTRVTEFDLWIYECTLVTANVTNVYVHIYGYLRACHYSFISQVNIVVNCSL